jgi:hypothetical protein
MRKLIQALYKIIASEYTLVSWEFDQRIFKKTYMSIKQILTENDIKSYYPKSEWPHISIALVQKPNNEERNKIKLAAPIFKDSYKVIGVEILPGMETVDYVTLEIDVPTKHKEYFQFLIDILGDGRVQKPRSYPKFKPHASIITVDKKDTERAKQLLPQIEKAIKPYLSTYKPENILIWDDFEISEIEKALL